MIVLRWNIVLIMSVVIFIILIGTYYASHPPSSSPSGESGSVDIKTEKSSQQNSSNNSSNIQPNNNENTNNQENPVTVSLRLIDYCNDFTQTKNFTELDYVKNSANWLIVNARNYGSYSLYEYKFPSDYNVTRPLHSALAQGFAIQALIHAYAITQNATYLNATKPLLNSFYVDVKDGGVSEQPAKNGLWYEAYAGNNNRNPHELTGMMYVLLALHDYYHYTNDTKSEYLFKQGVSALKVNVANYDDEGNSYDDALSTVPTDPQHHKIQVDLLTQLYDITGVPIFKEYRDKWKSYMESHSNGTALTSSTPSGMESTNVKIAIIRNTFTGGAYNDAFYKFYAKYYTWPPGKNITNYNAYPGFGLDLLTGAIPDYDTGGYNTWYIPFMQRHIKSILSTASVTVINDQDVHKGLIFNKNGSNTYDLLILGHQEYVTQQEYDNLRAFVNNGGKIIFLDGNLFYAEVLYDTETNSVTLVKGHGWKFNGNDATKTSLERWFNETSKWVGGNYLPKGGEKINFTNNIFNYDNSEETYVNNPNDMIILDYGAQIPNNLGNATLTLQCPDCSDYGAQAQQDLAELKIATYELNYGRGNIINLGIYAENVFGNPEFNLFFDSLVKGLFSNNPSSYNYISYN